jgi:peptidoglycan hydrolase CwlO-like protein
MELTGQIILTTFTAIIGYVVGYKKNQTDIEGSQLDNLEKSIRIYQVVIDDLSKKIEELSMHVVRLESTIDSLKQENKRLKSKKTIQE